MTEEEQLLKIKTEYADNLKRITDMAYIMGHDCKAHLEAGQDSQNQIARRAYVRSVFAFIEGIIFGMKQTSTYLGGPTGRLDIKELIAITEKTIEINGKGEAFEKPAFTRFVDNFKFTFRVFGKCHSSDFAPDLNTKGWSKLQDAIKVRDRLMHPKETSDLEVSNSELEAAKIAFDWFFINHALSSLEAGKAVKLKLSAPAEEIAESNEKISDLKRGLLEL
jgi:hypothetical protein